jgi:hypothetical protein
VAPRCLSPLDYGPILCYKVYRPTMIATDKTSRRTCLAYSWSFRFTWRFS